VGRLLGLVTHNWPLKIGAFVLATLLYSGLVLSQNARVWPGRVPIEAVNQPANAFLLENLGDVSSIRFYAPADVAARVTNADFRAVVDMAGVVPVAGGQPVAVRVTVTVLDPRITILDFQPQRVAVRLDPVVTRSVPVAVDHGSVPAGLVIGEPSLGTSTVTIRGASSLVARVQEALARVMIDPTGINVDGDVQLVAVDVRGDVVSPVDIEPDRIHVGISVDRVVASRSLPVAPQLSGAPSAGFTVRSVTVDPAVVTVLGSVDLIGALQVLSTAPVSLVGRSADFSATVALRPPDGVSVAGAVQVVVSVRLAAARGSRAFGMGLGLVGASTERSYVLSVPEVLVTLGGTSVALDALDAAALQSTLDVASLPFGASSVVVQFTPPPGMTLVSISPTSVNVTVLAGPTPPPEPTPTP
jgi:YbbR domain-containing protein